LPACLAAYFFPHPFIYFVFEKAPATIFLPLHPVTK
jgi:hypothetical protein